MAPRLTPTRDVLSAREEVDTYHTDPLDADTDDDGAPDGTDPKPLVKETLYFGRTLRDWAPIAGIIGAACTVLGFIIRYIIRRDS